MDEKYPPQYIDKPYGNQHFYYTKCEKCGKYEFGMMGQPCYRCKIKRKNETGGEGWSTIG